MKVPEGMAKHEKILLLFLHINFRVGKSVRVGKMEINPLSKLEEISIRSQGTTDLSECINSLQMLSPINGNKGNL